MAHDKTRGIDYAARAEQEAQGTRRLASLPDRDEPASRDTYGIEARARREWESSPAIREEFWSLEGFIAFRRAEARGAVRIISRAR